jgi:flagellar biosynthesis protein FliR
METMMDYWIIPFEEFKKFLLVLTRVSIVLFMFPFFNARFIPVMLKAGLALLVTIALLPILRDVIAEFPGHAYGMVQLILSELVIGMTLGLMIQVFFEGVRMMGQLVGFQTGFAIANIIDPQNGIQVSIIANTAYMVAITVFLVLNGHHIILGAMRESFDVIPMGSIGLDRELFQTLIGTFGSIFVLALKMGAPAIAALLFTKVVFGLITKLIPQMNIMIVAFPVQIIIGLFFFGISLNVLLIFMERFLKGMHAMLIGTMHLLI